MKLNAFTAVLCTAIVCSVPAVAQMDTVFTYQGQLIDAGAPANGSYSMGFKVFDALVGGSQFGSMVTIADQAVSDGIFSAQLDVGALNFSGTPYWLEIVIDGSTLSPRQAITASPFSIQTRGLFVNNDNRVGIGTTAPSFALHVKSDFISILGESITNGDNSIGVYGKSFSTTGHGVSGEATASTGKNYGVFGTTRSTSGHGVYGESTADTGFVAGGWFESDSVTGIGVFGQAKANTGRNTGGWFESDSTSGRGVFGKTYASSGETYGGLFVSCSTSGRGVYGSASASSGVTYGGRFEVDSTVGRGVFGFASANSGVNYGVVGHSNSSSGFDFWASGAGTNYGSPSSRRFKSNIEPIGNPLDKLAKLQGVYFDWDDEHGGQHDIGMIAEEVGKVLPEIVNYEENGLDAIGMDYSKLTPLLVEATNALRIENQQLKDNNQLLNARLDRLERMMGLVLDK